MILYCVQLIEDNVNRLLDYFYLLVFALCRAPNIVNLVHELLL